jgi:CBS-domain-containing membrane protein
MLQSHWLSSFRVHWRRWRAPWSLPALLARYDERNVVALVAAINAVLTILSLGVIAWLIDAPLILAALGPTAFLLFVRPFSPEAAPRNVVIGHGAGVLAGAGVRAAWTILVPAVYAAAPAADGPTLCAAAAALALTCLLLVHLDCPHAPACASALIIAVGGLPEWRGVLALPLAAVIVTLQAVLVARLAGLNVPAWWPRAPQS